MGRVWYCFSHFLYTHMAPVIVIGLILVLIFNTEKEKYNDRKEKKWGYIPKL